MNVDQAFERFRQIRADVPAEDDRPIFENEACTRVHLIDPILTDVLGWPREHIRPEVPGGLAEDGAGDVTRRREGRVDYLLLDHGGTCWFVIEAKKRSRPVVEVRPGIRGLEVLKLTGPVLGAGCWRIIDGQMASYMGTYMPAFGGVTTGEQWVGFLGRVRPEDRLLGETHAAVFRSLDDIEKDFEEFYEIFGLQGARGKYLLRRVEPSRLRGVVRAIHPKRVVPIGEERPVDYQTTDSFYTDLRRAMEAAFRPIRDDRHALAKCFVESRESRDASSRLARMANELGSAMRDATEEYPVDVRAQVGQVQPPAPGSLDWARPGEGYLARLLGEHSAGKTAFLRRLFDLDLTAQRQQIVLLWVDAERFDTGQPDSISRDVFEQLKTELFGEDGPDWNQLREVYRREWHQRLRLLGVNESEAAPDLRQTFIGERLAGERQDPMEAIRRYAAFSTQNRRRLVCLVVDNLDHLPQPEAVITWAMGLHTSVFAMTTVAMEDATLWRLRAGERDQLANHQPEQFWLYRPMVRDVLANRCEYLKELLGQGAGGGSRTSTQVGRRGQWRWTVDPEKLVRVVSAVLLDRDETTNWIGQICNYDLGEVLEVCQQIIMSPHIRPQDLLQMNVVQAPRSYRVLRALIAPKSEQFQGLPTDRVMNIFGHWVDHDWAPLLPARLLVVLRAREDDDRNRGEVFSGFVARQRLEEAFETGFGVPRDVTASALQRMSTLHLIEPFNPAARREEDRDGRVKITPRGRLHLDWALKQATYVRLMGEVDLLTDDSLHADLRWLWNQWLAALASQGAEVRRGDAGTLERQMVRRYVAHILTQAQQVSFGTDLEETTPIRAFEDQLRSAWVV